MAFAAMAQPSVSPRSEIFALVAVGDYDAARRSLAQVAANDLDRAFLEGLILEHSGQLDAATELYRGVVARRPDLVQFRERLVRVLIQLQNWNGAAFHLEDLISRTQDPATRARLNRLRNDILSRRRSGLAISGGFIPSTNANRATSNTVTPFVDGLEATIDETRASGLGFGVTTRAFARVSRQGGAVLEFDLGVTGTAYYDPDFNRAAVSTGARLSWPAGTGRWGLGIRGTAYYFADAADQARRLTISADRGWLLQRRAVTLRLDASQTDYRDPSNAGFDARGVALSASVSGRLGSRTVGRVTIRSAIDDAVDDRFSYISTSADLRIARTSRNSSVVSAGPYFEVRNYRDPFTAPFNIPRRDTSVGLGISAYAPTWRIGGAAPRIDCTLRQTRSNITIYDNRDVAECALSLTRAF